MSVAIHGSVMLVRADVSLRPNVTIHGQQIG